MSYLDIDLLCKLSGTSSTGETSTSKTGSSTGSNTVSRIDRTMIQSYEDELCELDETSDLDIEEIIESDASVEEIEKEIEAKEKEIEELQEKTEEYIEKCQQEIEDIIANGTDYIPQEVQTKYKSELNSILSSSSSNTKTMQEIMAVISENEIVIEKAQKEIEEKEKEIEELQEKISALEESGDEDSESEIASLQSEIDGLNSEIEGLQSAISDAESVISNSNSEYSDLESENSSLTEEQDGLMAKLMEEYYSTHTEEDRVYEDSGLASEISILESYISTANTNLSENVLKLTEDVTLLTQQKAIKEQEAVQEAASSTSSTYSTGSTYTGELSSDNTLAENARSVASSMNTSGWCLKGVNNALEATYGFRLSYNSAYQAISGLQSRSDYTEVTNQYPSGSDLTNLPAGAIVVWENSSSHPHGHISIALGNGQEASDHIQSQTTNYGTQYHVFIKTS